MESWYIYIITWGFRRTRCIMILLSLIHFVFIHFAWHKIFQTLYLSVFLPVLLSTLIAVSTFSVAQDGSVPGLQVRNLLVTEIEEGAAVEQAAEEVSQTVLNESMFFDAVFVGHFVDKLL